MDLDNPGLQDRRLVPYSSNWPSAVTLAEKVEEHPCVEVRASSLYPSVAAEPNWVPSQEKRLGKFRLIVDLSLPRGGSVNDAISPTHALFNCITVKEVAELIPEGILLAKLDLKAAYRPSGGSAPPRNRKCSAIDPAIQTKVSSHYFQCGRRCSRLCIIPSGITHYLDDLLIWLASCSQCYNYTNSSQARPPTRSRVPHPPSHF